ncbi:outer membrane receptor protein involved in Fe transport [Lewinella aquimaris]|uniref:Outer membrane receptor protein involved in Fe transport n=1 Tax=Neolewinella aquimaris TaxID=1835722 RepID=A0A840E930_9BACT|nr:TonB-dependent receptor [Neolewinella aquimaris]MBB4077556.1 outer membrane receptor protein involved in Fe transport [Neolewinella aquimaris]
MLNRIYYVVALLLVTATAFAQKGAISGTVYDEDGFPMLGANVVIQGTSIGAQTDFIEGKYQFKVDPGTYNIVTSYVGYGEHLSEGIVVTANQTTILDITFGEDSGVELELDVTVTAQALERGEVAVMKLRQNSDKVQDVISSQEIQRLGAGTAAAALTKVTGTTVVDGKYVYVRGLGDRYSATTLNGLQLPSIDPYRNSAQLDLIPTNLLDNITASKTFTPDLPGDFTGGSVNIKIKALPERFTWGVSASGSYNDLSNFRNDFMTFDGGKKIGLGYNDGTLDGPAILNDPRLSEMEVLEADADRRSRSDAALATAVHEVANSFGNAFNLGTKRSGPDYGLSANIGNQFNIGTMPLGVFATVSYNRDYSQYTNGVRGNYVNPNLGENQLQEVFDLTDSKSVESGKLGGMVGFALRPSPANNITFYTIYSHQGFLEGRVLKGSNERKGAAGTDDNYYYSQAASFLERQLIDYVLQGDHTLTGLGNTKIEWSANYINSQQNEPDLRFYEYIEQDGRFLMDPSQFSRPSRYFRDLSDNSYQGTLDVTVPVLQNKSKGNAIKFGGQYRTKERDFNESIYAYENDRGLSFTEAGGDFDVYLGPGNLGAIEQVNGRNSIGVYVYDNSNLANSYTGKFDVAAAYAMMTYEVTPRLKAIFGLRVENTRILVESDKVPNEYLQAEVAGREPDLNRIAANTADIDTTSLMPALNLVYKVGENSNLRGSFTQTIARPNMREVAPFGSFGFLGEPPVFGNPNLKLTSVDNYDLRYEIFPHAGEVLAFSAFYKRFRNPIVTTFRIAGDQQFTWTNSESADLYGLEVEFRKSLGFLNEKLDDFTVSSNLAFIQAEQRIDEQEVALGQAVDPSFSAVRRFNGQSPFVANANLSYATPESGWDFVAAYNFFGDRLQSIGAVGSPDIFERGRSQLDVSVSKKVDNFKFSLRARNLLNPAFESFSTFDREYIFQSYERGREFSFGVSYGI